MNGGQHELTACTGSNRCRGGSGIANFTNHYDIGTVTKHGRKTLAEFFPEYIEVLARKVYRNHILDIRVEGHTSSEWGQHSGTDRSYFRNLTLSQARAREVAEYLREVKERSRGSQVIDRVLSMEWEWLKARMTVTGLSSSKPVYFDGTWKENKDCSRRVEFRVITDSEDKLRRILKSR